MTKKEQKAISGQHWKIVKQTYYSEYPPGPNYRAFDEPLFNSAFTKTDALRIMAYLGNVWGKEIRGARYLSKGNERCTYTFWSDEGVSDATKSVMLKLEPVDDKDNLPLKKKPIFQRRMSKSPGKGLERVLKVEWIESERGWGIRPDGFSLHINKMDGKKYVKNYWEDMPSFVPDEYSRPTAGIGNTYVDRETFAEIKNSRCGVRYWGSEFEGGIERWI